jgi:hypothetical protein
MGGDGGITRRAFLKLATVATAASALSALPVTAESPEKGWC